MMFIRRISTILPVQLALWTGMTLGQTWSDCDPRKQTDCPNDIALGVANYSIDFQSQVMDPKVWNTTMGEIDYREDLGARFIIQGKRESPTIQSNFHIFFGQVEVIMLAAAGQGIVSSVVLQSADLDEIDWEWIGGNHTHVQTNYFGKGDTSTYDRAIWHEVDSPQTKVHNYTIDWQKDKTDFYVDDKVVRRLTPEEANGGKNYPQTPADVRLGIWPGGDEKNPDDTIEWSGGKVDYDEAPFTMAVMSVRVSDASTATEYRWRDQSGSMESIEVINGEERAFSLDGNNRKGMRETAGKEWQGLSKNAQIGIACGVVSALAIGAAITTFCCIKQRRAGRRERALEDAKFEKGTSELLEFRAEMKRQQTIKMQDNSKEPFDGGRI